MAEGWLVKLGKQISAQAEIWKWLLGEEEYVNHHTLLDSFCFFFWHPLEHLKSMRGVVQAIDHLVMFNFVI